jgi:hypothetical protein
VLGSLAPKGRDKIAQGNARGEESNEMALAQQGALTVNRERIISPFQGFGCLGLVVPGRCPGLSYLAPLGLRPGALLR